jgi:glycerophosphoryl diester phosphodiesterase
MILNSTKIFGKIFIIIIFITLPFKLYSDSDINFVKKKLIAHAGGKIDNYIYTNSYQAVLNSIKNDIKIIEIDLRLTSDDVFVGIHSWDDIEKILNNKISSSEKKYFEKKIINNNFSYQDINKLNFFLKYKIIDEFDINQIFKNNPDLILVTDKTNDFKKINMKFDFNDRIIVEIFGPINFFKSLFYKFKKKVFASDLSFVHKLFINIFGISSISVDYNLLQNDDNVEFIENYISKNNEVFVYTVNDKKIIQKLIPKFATYIYTDEIH